jgi:hypothetical protein
VTTFNVRPPEEGESLDGLDHFDFTKLSAVNTCPRWGIIRYGHHKVFSTSSRSMALEAGSACHDVFAAGRLFDLYHNGPAIYGNSVKSQTVARAVELFGVDRAERMLSDFTEKLEDERTRLLRGCLYILESSGFYDDPSDKRRTLDNLTECCIAYLDRYEFNRNVPYVRGDFVGVENAFGIIVEWDGYKCLFTGKIDGVHCWHNDRTVPYIEENKTSSRLGDAWEQSFDTSHQVTGYIVAASAIVGSPLDTARVRGLAIPQPRIYNSNGVSTVTVTRRDHHFQRWAEWFMHSVAVYRKFFDDPLDAPMYTHSCNRYFRPCSYIPLCASSKEEATEYLGQMEEDEWSPLHEKSGD